jgi:hypothetical protein
VAKKDQESTPWSKTGDTKASDKRPVRYTLIVRLPFPRGDFVDPPPVNWDTAKDRKLWKLISRTGAKLTNAGGASSASASEGGAGGSEVDWDAKAAEFGVDTRFLLQQAAWLYERHLEHVKKQVGRLRAGSTVGTPVPGQTSMMGKKPMPSSRAPSSMSMRSRDSPLPRVDTTVANASQARPSTLSRTPSTATVTQSRQFAVPPSPRPRSLRAPTVKKQPSSTLRSPTLADDSPGAASSSSSEDSSDEDVAKMSKSHAAFRRPPRFLANRQAARNKLGHDGDDEDDDSEDDEDDEPTFYSTAQIGDDGQRADHADRDLGETLTEAASRKGKHIATERTGSIEKPKAPVKQVDSSSKHLKSTHSIAAAAQQISRPTSAGRTLPTESSADSLSSANAPANAPRQNAPIRRPAHPLSPRHRADLARLTSPGRQGETSDGTPSMGSSFSDLDVDASISQSALEEAVASNLRNGGSRLSNLGNAFRSRYM